MISLIGSTRPPWYSQVEFDDQMISRAILFDKKVCFLSKFCFFFGQNFHFNFKI